MLYYLLAILSTFGAMQLAILLEHNVTIIIYPDIF
jgi:hypothetical protein